MQSFKQLYRDGALSWRNPLALTLYSITASILLLFDVFWLQATWMIWLAVGVWVFTSGMIAFCIVGATAVVRERKKIASKRKREVMHEE